MLQGLLDLDGVRGWLLCRVGGLLVSANGAIAEEDLDGLTVETLQPIHKAG